MNTKEFVKVLRAVIREEVRSAVRQEMSQLLMESKPTLRSQQTKQQPRKQPASLTGNPILDQVLSETKLTSEFRQSADVGYDDFGTFNTNSIPIQQQQASIMDMDVQEDYESPLPEMNPTMPFIKDYTQLMKRADQIASQKQF